MTEIENKIPDISNLGTKTALTTIENKIPDVSNFATKTELTNLSDKVPDITTLIKKGDYNTKIVEIENKYVSNSGFNTKLGEANVITKRNFDAKIIEIKNSIKKLKTFDLSYFKGKNHFEADSTQNYLVFQPIHRQFKFRNINGKWYITSWKSKGLYYESIKPPVTSDNSLTPELNYYAAKIKAKFTGSYLKQPTLQYHHKNIVNIYIVYELGASTSYNNDPTLKIVYLVQLL